MAITWQEVQPAGDVDKDWAKCLSSADGTVLIALHSADIGYVMYVSVDSGETWENRSPGDVYLIEMSTDASIIFVACYSGDDYFLYVSNDYGESWAELTDNPSEGGVSKIAVSGGGTTIYASTAENKLFKATEWLLPGDPWEEITIPEVASIRSVSVNEDGTIILICYEEAVYLSIDGGGEWAELDPLQGDIELSEYISVSISADGQKLVVCFYDDSFYDATRISLDGGQTWSFSETQVVDTVVTRDGTKMLLAQSFSPAYSENDGVNWTSFQPGDVPAPPEGYSWFWASTINTNNLLTGNLLAGNPF